MKNLTKHLLLLIAILPSIILLSSVFAEKSSAQQNFQIQGRVRYIGRTNPEWYTNLLVWISYSDSSRVVDGLVVEPKTGAWKLSRTFPPGVYGVKLINLPANCTASPDNQDVIISNKDKNDVIFHLLCSEDPTPTPTPIPALRAPSPTPTPVPASLTQALQTTTHRWTQVAVCSLEAPTPTTGPCPGGVCPTPTPTPTPTIHPSASATAPTDCITAGGTCKASSSECLANETFKLTNQCLSRAQACCIPVSTPTPNPAQPPSPTPDTRCNVIQNGTEYFCATTSTCPSGSTPSTGRRCFNQVCCARPAAVTTTTTPPSAPPPTTATCHLFDKSADYRCSADSPGPDFKRVYREGLSSNCNANEGCWVRDLPPVPTATSAPGTPTLNVTLVMALNIQDTALSDDSLPVKLALYNLTTNTLVSGAPATQSFARTPIPQRQYAANISLTNLAPDKYFIVARRDNMIAKSVFTVTSATGNIKVPTTTLVFGDIKKDNDINALDYQLLRPCYKKTITANASCLASDFDKNEVIDQVDLNTLLRGWATWNKEGKEL